MSGRLKCGFTLFLLVFLQTVMAAPYVPTSDAQVLERLPFKANDPVAGELTQLRAALQRNPRDAAIAVDLGRRYYSLVAAEGDPRYIGYAQAALAPWWDLPDPPLEVLVLRASLRQFRHDFAGALADLDQALTRNPRHPQARSLRAIIHIVQARYALAQADCLALRGVADELIALGCESMVQGLTGQTAEAYARLSKMLERHPESSRDEQLWILTRLAEMAQRLGRDEAAEAHFKRALALDISDTFLLAAYADFLLDHGRAAEVVTLLKDKVRSDTLLLRLVFAEHALKLPTAKASATMLADRFQAAKLRGDTVHQQEEARFALHVAHDAKAALALALENWKVQREPRDARIVLEAALAAKEPAAAKPALDWFSENHNEDPTLRRLAQQLKALP
jgi:tetratricopeptide (TPR) repeat protein